MPNPEFLAGQLLPAAKLQLLGHQETFTPSLSATTTSPGLGTGPVASGILVRNGNGVDMWVWIQFGTSPSAGSGTYRVDLPTGYTFSGSLFGGAIGEVWLNDNSTGAVRVGVAMADVPTDTIWMRTTSDNALVTNAAPWTWAANDVIGLHVRFPID